MTYEMPFAQYFEDFQKNLPAFGSFPQVTTEDITDYTKKNLEAATEINKVLFDAVKTASEKQVALTKEKMEDLQLLAGEAFKGELSPETFEKNNEALKDYMSSYLKGAQEVSEILVDAGKKAGELAKARYDEVVEAAKVA